MQFKAYFYEKILYINYKTWGFVDNLDSNSFKIGYLKFEKAWMS